MLSVDVGALYNRFFCPSRATVPDRKGPNSLRFGSAINDAALPYCSSAFVAARLSCVPFPHHLHVTLAYGGWLATWHLQTTHASQVHTMAPDRSMHLVVQDRYLVSSLAPRFQPPHHIFTHPSLGGLRIHDTGTRVTGIFGRRVVTAVRMFVTVMLSRTESIYRCRHTMWDEKRQYVAITAACTSTSCKIR